jgi:hypothetical protein
LPHSVDDIVARSAAWRIGGESLHLKAKVEKFLDRVRPRLISSERLPVKPGASPFVSSGILTAPPCAGWRLP